MAVHTRLRHAAATDPGRRSNNEDRFFALPEMGIYGVVDGVGGHAAGERAAEVAVEVIRERLSRQSGTPEERLREAIALANNEIYRLSRTRPDWNGMACVLTVALVEDDFVTVGHVGDSRLYLLRAGEIRKMTHDHSPVGEREDRGELTEAEAMRHARRNEIYRDVGAEERNPDDPRFIEIVPFPMPADGALLLCSDGLTDLVSSAEIRAGVNRYAPDLERAVRALIDAANRAGGKDNITVILISGPEFAPQPDTLTAEPLVLAGDTAKPARRARWPWAVAGLAAGLALGALLPIAVPVLKNRFESSPRTYVVNNSSIESVLGQAHSGDTVLLPAATYKEPINLREGVTVRAQQVGRAILLAPVTANGIQSGELEGVAIQGDAQNPLGAGIHVVNSAVTISNVKITGAMTGIAVSGKSDPLITASQITNNSGPGVTVSGDAKPRIIGNLIAANGNGKPGAAKPGVEVRDSAKPVLKDNAIVDNAADPVWILGRNYQPHDFEENFFGGLPAKRAIRVLVPEQAAAPAAEPAAKPQTKAKTASRRSGV